jgi:hypothetical protein
MAGSAVVAGAGLWLSRGGRAPEPPSEHGKPPLPTPPPGARAAPDAGERPSCRIAGVVVDAEGRGLEGAEVSLHEASAAPDRKPGAPAWRPAGDLGVYTGPLPLATAAARAEPTALEKTRTDAAGRFTFDRAPAGAAIVVATHALGRAELRADLREGGPPLRLQLTPPPPSPAPAESSGAAPPQVKVRDARTLALLSAATVTVSDGLVHVRARGYASLDVPLPDRGRELVVDLERAAELQGRVLDASGYPAAGVVIEAGGDHAESDRRGEFRLSSVQPGAAAVRARGGAAGEATLELTLAPGEQRRGVELRLEKTKPE